MLILEQSENDKLTLLKKAIDDKVEISFWYKGVKFRDPKEKKYTKQSWRFAQPTDLGRSKATNKWMLRAYQLTGVSNTKKPAWKTFLVDEMSSITVMDGEDGGYHPFDKPSGSDYNLMGDKKMKNDRPEYKIDINKKPKQTGLNKGELLKNKQEPQQNEPETDIENVNENKGFLHWVLNLNYGT
jgi:hypothetical protein